MSSDVRCIRQLPRWPLLTQLRCTANPPGNAEPSCLVEAVLSYAEHLQQRHADPMGQARGRDYTDLARVTATGLASLDSTALLHVYGTSASERFSQRESC